MFGSERGKKGVLNEVIAYVLTFYVPVTGSTFSDLVCVGHTSLRSFSKHDPLSVLGSRREKSPPCLEVLVSVAGASL